ncbi:MAG: hypothetical protein F8N37_12190 [Telmatospirillum sp.]|nr:hypothetical protein [Telmatospirillum sp.]
MPLIITTPGIYDIPLDLYHADPCETPSLSASGMVDIVDDCPARFFYKSRRLNPKAERETTKDMSVSSAAHAWILQGDKFAETIAVMPPELDLRSNAGKAFAAQAEGESKTLIRAHEFEQIKAMREAILRSELARLALSAGKPEQSLFWKDEETGVWLRCRPDWLPTALRIIPDFKAMRSCIPADVQRVIREYGYHIQAAHYLAGIEAVTGHRPENFVFVVQEKTAPYLVSLVAPDDISLWYGGQLARRAIRIFSDCLCKGIWPGHDGQVCVVGLPGWALKEYEAMEAAGLFDAPQSQPQHMEAAE